MLDEPPESPREEPVELSKEEQAELEGKSRSTRLILLVFAPSLLAV